MILGTCLHHDSARWPQFPVLPTPPNQPRCTRSEMRIPAGQTLLQLSFSISVPSWTVNTGDATSPRAHPSWTLISSPSSFGDPSSESGCFLHIVCIFVLWYGSFSMLCCSVTKLCLIPCDPMDSSTPGFPVLHYLPEVTQTHVHWVGDAIPPSHPLSPSSPSAL